MKIIYELICFVAFINAIFACTEPLLYTWVQSTGTGYGGIVNNVRSIKYSTDYVYINSGGIPSYDIGPWEANPNTPSDQKFIFKFRRTPLVSSGSKTATAMGNIGVWLNGVTIYNADDGYSYNSLGVWKRNAYYWEGISFDACYGHPDGQGNYHNHVNPTCLYDSTDSTTHSPIIGWSFDGFPIYGPFGYSNSQSSNSAIRRIYTSYRLRNITKRTTLSNGTTLSSKYYGPDISDSYPLGSYIQDYEYVSGYGDLDEYNGRYTKTPEYPDGTYAYFVATDSNGDPAYPFSIGPSYYGMPVTDNIGVNSGKITIKESVETYYAYSSSY